MLPYSYAGYGYPVSFDWTYFLVIIGLVVTMIANAKLKKTVARYGSVLAASGLTGVEVAKKILQANGIYNVTVHQVSGSLSDHFDPRNQTVNLSTDVYGKATITAVGVAAHECGHAIQHNEEYFPLKIRTFLVPIANFGSRMAWPLILGGLILGAVTQIGPILTSVGICLYALAVLVQLVTLPVEYNASNRALKQLESLGILKGDELNGAKDVLGAAAWTYVAAASTGLLNMLRMIFLTKGGNRRR